MGEGLITAEEVHEWRCVLRSERVDRAAERNELWDEAVRPDDISKFLRKAWETCESVEIGHLVRLCWS